MDKMMKKIDNNQVKWDLQVDVVIIGTGFAGLSAAIEAHNHGAKVLVIEKTKALGGNSIISDGGIAAPETFLQEKYHIKDSKESMYEDMLKAGLSKNQPELVKTLVNCAKEAFDWSKDYLGVKYLDRVDIFGGHSVPRCYTAEKITGGTIIRQFKKKLIELGIEVRFDTAFIKFVVDENNIVCGILVNEKGNEIYIKTLSGVVLATGGFGSDVPFRMEQDPRLDASIQTTNKPFATAEGLKAVLDIGGVTVDLDQIQLGPWASPDEKGYGDGPQFSEYIVFQYGVIVDPTTGKRFVNELEDRKTLSDKILDIGHPAIGIADAVAVEESGWDISKCLRKEVVKEFNSLKELAMFYDIPQSQLQITLADFNSSFEKGEDTRWNKPLLTQAKPIVTPPYFAIRLWPKVHYTMGGLKINVKSEVMHKNGHCIKGLYAAGEVTGGIHGASRLGSCSITECFVFGRIAGKQVAIRNR